MKNYLKHFIAVLPSEYKIKVFVFLFATSFGSALEVFGVAALIPFVSILISPQKFYSHNFVVFIQQNFEILGPWIDPFSLGVIFVFLYLSGLLFRFISLFLAVSFATNLEYDLGKKMVRYYVAQDYEWYAMNHSADIVQQVLAEVSNVVHGTIFSVLMIVSQSLLMGGLLVFLLIINPLAVGIGLLVFGFLYGIIFLFLRQYIAEIGRRRIEANRGRAKSLIEMCGSIIELKTGGYEEYFIERFILPSAQYAKYQKIAQLSAQAPKFLIDGVIFLCMTVALISLAKYAGDNFVMYLPMLGALVLAAYKMLPATQVIYASAVQLKFSEAAFKDLLGKLNKANKVDQCGILLPNAKEAESFARLRFNDVSFHYNGKSEIALSNFSASFDHRDFVFIVGPTGSGKSTFLKVFMGLLKPTSGQIVFNGGVIEPFLDRGWRKAIGYVPQDVYLLDDTVARNIAFGEASNDIDWDRLLLAAKIARVDEFVGDDHMVGYHTNVGENGSTLSGGQRQRIGLARAIYQTPKILVLDEATSALDSETEKAVLEGIKELSFIQLTLFVTHRTNVISPGAKVLVMENGKILNTANFEELRQLH
ncbi:MAG: ABC transporter ATP-binding protein [Pseudomonadota bacterium]|nr:ABC transporter ATP-binding protein [Pseudomonadota bacterium]